MYFMEAELSTPPPWFQVCPILETSQVLIQCGDSDDVTVHLSPDYEIVPQG